MRKIIIFEHANKEAREGHQNSIIFLLTPYAVKNVSSLVPSAFPDLLLDAFFYCAVVCVVQPLESEAKNQKQSVNNPPFRGRQRTRSDVRLSTGDLHGNINTAERAKIVRELRGYRTEWPNWEKDQLINLSLFFN